MIRKRQNKRRDKKYFTRTAKRVKSKNFKASARGGIRA